MAYHVPPDAVPYQERGPFTELQVEVPVSYYARVHAIPRRNVCDDAHLNYMEEDVHIIAYSPAGTRCKLWVVF